MSKHKKRITVQFRRMCYTVMCLGKNKFTHRTCSLRATIMLVQTWIRAFIALRILHGSVSKPFICTPDSQGFDRRGLLCLRMSRVTVKLHPLFAAMLWLACTPHTATSTWFKSRMTNKRQFFFGVKTWHCCQKYCPVLSLGGWRDVWLR